jgi:hypothetical protein
MPSNPAKPFLVSREDDPELQPLNEKISKLAAVKPPATHLAPSRLRLIWPTWPSKLLSTSDRCPA